MHQASSIQQVFIMSEPIPTYFRTPRYEELSITYSQRDSEDIAIIKNFPGILAEMNEKELRQMGNTLIKAADQLAKTS